MMVSISDIKTVFSILAKTHQPTMLEQFQHYTPFQLLVMTLLSARTRDSTTIPIARTLFKEASTPRDFLNISLPKLQEKLYGIGFYRVKAKHIQGLSAIIFDKYHGTVPNTFEELTSLPGVGRKTANCLLAYAFHKPAIAVDIHVHRISNRLGWITTQTPEASEEALQKLIPTSQWREVNSLFVDHGQRICLPITPKCEICPINIYCAYGRQKLGLTKKTK